MERPVFGPARVDQLKAELVAEHQRRLDLRYAYARSYLASLQALYDRLPSR